MAQIFADGEQLGGADVDPARSQPPGWPMVRQRSGSPELPLVPADTLGPALTAGKGVRPVRCVGCTQATLPRQDDNAPLCVRCSDLLADSAVRAGASSFWRRRRLAAD